MCKTYDIVFFVFIFFFLSLFISKQKDFVYELKKSDEFKLEAKLVSLLCNANIQLHIKNWVICQKQILPYNINLGEKDYCLDKQIDAKQTENDWVG